MVFRVKLFCNFCNLPFEPSTSHSLEFRPYDSIAHNSTFQLPRFLSPVQFIIKFSFICTITPSPSPSRSASLPYTTPTTNKQKVPSSCVSQTQYKKFISFTISSFSSLRPDYFHPHSSNTSPFPPKSKDFPNNSLAFLKDPHSFVLPLKPKNKKRTSEEHTSINHRTTCISMSA